MVKFVNEEAEMDLGEIGKFKPSFLKELMKLCPSPVEKAYRERIDDYDRRIKFLKSYRIGLFCNLGEVRRLLHELDEYERRKQKLIADFEKYFEAFPNRVCKGAE